MVRARAGGLASVEAIVDTGTRAGTGSRTGSKTRTGRGTCRSVVEMDRGDDCNRERPGRVDDWVQQEASCPFLVARNQVRLT